VLTVWVSNSLSGRDRELDKVPAVGDPTHIVQLGTGDRVVLGGVRDDLFLNLRMRSEKLDE
jgi:hypothetical protein